MADSPKPSRHKTELAAKAIRARTVKDAGLIFFLGDFPPLRWDQCGGDCLRRRRTRCVRRESSPSHSDRTGACDKHTPVFSENESLSSIPAPPDREVGLAVCVIEPYQSSPDN